MHHEIQPAPFALQPREQLLQALLVFDVGFLDDLRAELLDHRDDALAECGALVGEGHLGAGGMQGLGDAPGDRAFVGHPHDQAALAGHQLGDGGEFNGLGNRIGGGASTSAGRVGRGREGPVFRHYPPQWS
jgi:hypothetical protein